MAKSNFLQLELTESQLTLFEIWWKQINGNNEAGSESNFQLLDNFAEEMSKTISEYADLASFPAEGSIKRFYIALDTGLCYRWDEATFAYVLVGGSGGETTIDSIGGFTVSFDANQGTNQAYTVGKISHEKFNEILAGMTMENFVGNTAQALSSSVLQNMYIDYITEAGTVSNKVFDNTLLGTDCFITLYRNGTTGEITCIEIYGLLLSNISRIFIFSGRQNVDEQIYPSISFMLDQFSLEETGDTLIYIEVPSFDPVISISMSSNVLERTAFDDIEDINDKLGLIKNNYDLNNIITTISESLVQPEAGVSSYYNTISGIYNKIFDAIIRVDALTFIINRNKLSALKLMSDDGIGGFNELQVLLAGDLTNDAFINIEGSDVIFYIPNGLENPAVSVTFQADDQVLVSNYIDSLPNFTIEIEFINQTEIIPLQEQITDNANKIGDVPTQIDYLEYESIAPVDDYVREVDSDIFTKLQAGIILLEVLESESWPTWSATLDGSIIYNFSFTTTAGVSHVVIDGVVQSQILDPNDGLMKDLSFVAIDYTYNNTWYLQIRADNTVIARFYYFEMLVE